MKQNYLFLIVALVLSAGVWPGQVKAANWTPDFDKALETGKEENKPVLVFVYHPFSYHKADQKRADFLVWDSPVVAKMMAKFIQVHVNVEKQSELGTRLGAHQYPAVLFFDPKGREILALRLEDKKLTRSRVVTRLKQVLNRIDEFDRIEQQIKVSDSDPQLVLQYAKGLRDRAQFDRAEEHFNRLFKWKNLDPKIHKEADSANSLMIFYQASRRFYGGDYDQCIDLVQRFLAKSPKSASIHQANLLLGMALYESGEKKDAEKVLKRLARDKKAGIFKEKAKHYLDQKKKR